LTPFVGKDLEIIVLEEATAAVTDPKAKGNFLDSKSAQRVARDRGIKLIQSIDQLRGDDLADAFEGFDETLEEWRRQPWRAEDPLKDFDLPANKDE
jgi:hypothetical protein